MPGTVDDRVLSSVSIQAHRIAVDETAFQDGEQIFQGFQWKRNGYLDNGHFGPLAREFSRLKHREREERS